MVLELDIELEDPGSNRHSAKKLPDTEHYLSTSPTLHDCAADKKKGGNYALNSLEEGWNKNV